MKFCLAVVCITLLSVLIPACAPAPQVVPAGSSLDPTSTPIPTAAPIPPTPGVASPLELQRTRLYATDEVARLTAIAQLESDGSPQAVLILGKFFIESNVRGRLEAARALLRIHTAQSLNFIRTAMSDRQLTGRRQVAMQALEQDPEVSFPILRDLMSDPDEIVRLNAVQVVGFLGTPQGRQLLEEARNDASPAVQKAAIDALRGVGFDPSPTP